MDSLSMFLLILLACLGLGMLIREGVFKKPWLAVLCAILMAAAIALRASVFDRQTGDFVRDGRNRLLEATGVESWKQWCQN
jgi:hypothetical protein